MAWTDENVGVLKALWGEGRSAREIAGKLGMTRNAVIGKANRLGLAHKTVGLDGVAAPGYRCGMDVTDTDSEFDTLAYARTLKEAGVEEKQAEAHAEAARTIRAGLATKADLDAGLGRLGTRLDARIDLVETRLNARLDARTSDLETRLNARISGVEMRISGLETRMLRVAIAIVLAQTALTAALTAGLTFGLLRMFGGAP